MWGKERGGGLDEREVRARGRMCIYVLMLLCVSVLEIISDKTVIKSLHRILRTRL